MAKNALTAFSDNVILHTPYFGRETKGTVKRVMNEVDEDSNGIINIQLRGDDKERSDFSERIARLVSQKTGRECQIEIAHMSDPVGGWTKRVLNKLKEQGLVEGQKVSLPLEIVLFDLGREIDRVDISKTTQAIRRAVQESVEKHFKFISMEEWAKIETQMGGLDYYHRPYLYM